MKSAEAAKEMGVEPVKTTDKKDTDVPRASRHFGTGSQDVTKKTSVEAQKAVNVGSRVEGRYGVGAESIPKHSDQDRANFHRLQVLTRLKNSAATTSAHNEKNEELAQAAASLSLGCCVRFNAEVRSHEYDQNSPPNSEWAAALSAALHEDVTPSDLDELAPDLLSLGDPDNGRSGAFDLKVVEERTTAILAIGTAGWDELDEELIVLQCSLPDATQTNDFHSLGVSMKAIQMAQDAILAAMGDDLTDVEHVATAVETTERAHTVQEFTLRWVNDPTYDSKYTRSPYV
jgi:hypothetical protein